MYHNYIRNILNLYYLYESYPEFVAAVTSFSKWQKKERSEQSSRMIQLLYLTEAPRPFKADIKHDYNIYFKARILSKRQINKYPFLFLLPA